MFKSTKIWKDADWGFKPISHNLCPFEFFTFNINFINRKIGVELVRSQNIIAKSLPSTRYRIFKSFYACTYILTFLLSSCSFILFYTNFIVVFLYFTLVCVILWIKLLCLRCITTSPQSLNLNRKNIKVCETMCKLK